jgi:hypothetical protein
MRSTCFPNLEVRQIYLGVGVVDVMLMLMMMTLMIFFVYRGRLGREENNKEREEKE